MTSSVQAGAPFGTTMQPLTALITGGAGFIGSHLARALAVQGWAVHLLVRPGTDGSTTSDLHLQVHDGSTQGLIDIVGAVRPDLVFHLATYFRAEHQSADLEPMLHSNVVFATQLLEAMAVHGVRRLVNAGTTWQNYENRPYSPVCLYAASKQAFEALLQYYVEVRGVAAITLKLSDTFGPGDVRPKLLNLLLQAAAEGRQMQMNSGEQLMDVVHVDDVVYAFVVAAQLLLDGKVAGHERYAVRAGEVIPMRELVERFLAGRKLHVDIAWGVRPLRTREVMVPATVDPLLPGWHPVRSIFTDS